MTLDPRFRGHLPAGWRPEGITLIRYATRPTAIRGEHFYGHDECAQESMPIDYFVWLVTGPEKALLVDAGFTPEVADRRPGRIHLGSPLEVAEALGYPKSCISDVVVTHLHYDHTGYLSQLPASRLHIQERELAFWVGRHAHRPTFSSIVEIDDVVEIVRRNHAGSVDLIDGVSHIAQGVSTHRVGGHTPGMQVVRVELADGRVVVLASDASHFYENIHGDRPFSIAHTVPDMFDAFDTVRGLSMGREGKPGVIVPGHDPHVVDGLEPVFADDPRFDGRAWRIV